MITLPPDDTIITLAPDDNVSSQMITLGQMIPLAPDDNIFIPDDNI